MEARKEELLQLKDRLPELIKEIKELPIEPTSLGLAVQIEMVFSNILLEKLLANTQDNIMAAGQLLTFLKTRWDMLSNTAALGPYSRSTKINRACVLTAKLFSGFNTDLILQVMNNFDNICKEKEKEILQSEKLKLESAIRVRASIESASMAASGSDNAKIYQFIYHTVFANQTIWNAMSLVPETDQVVRTDNWRNLLDNIIVSVPDRATFIKILSNQVECKDWRFFISKIQNYDLYHLILKLNVDALFLLHKQKPQEEQGNNEFDLELLKSADELLRRKRTFLGYAGEVFKGLIEADHECRKHEEVSALAFCLLETYRRIREKLDEYTNPVGRVTSYFATVCTKQDKVDACDLAMQFILTKEVFMKDGLYNFLDGERKAGRLKQPAYDKFKIASEQGALKIILDAMFEVQNKVNRMAPRSNV